MLDTLIKGGTVLTDGAMYNADLGLRDGRVAGVWTGRDDLDAKEVIDATGKWVMPGAIDVHFHTQTGAAYFATRADDMESATRSAASAGITTVVPFVWGDPGQPISDYLTTFLELAERLSVCDYSAHCGLRPDMELIRQIPEAFALGITSFKMHHDYRKTGQGRMSDDDHRLAALELIGRSGGLGMFHCENGYVIDHLENNFIAAGQVSHEYFLKSRPHQAEAEAVHRTIVLGQLADCPVYVVHLSAESALWEIATAQARGVPVFTETCPQYLTLTNDALEEWGALAKVGPPLRTKPDNDAMWDGLRRGQIETIGSDHSAHTLDHKQSGGDDFFATPFGTAIVDVMLSVVFSEGVVKKRITPEAFVKAFTENPARRFGLYPRKGSLQPGADADVLVWDPTDDWTVRAEDLQNPCGYSVFEGWKLRGRAWRTWLRGRPLLLEGQVRLPAGSGQFVARS